MDIMKKCLCDIKQKVLLVISVIFWQLKTDLCFKESDVENINELNFQLYDLVVKLNESSIFTDFFENFIVFRFKLNYYNDYSENECECDCESLSLSDSDSDSDSDSYGVFDEIEDLLSDSD